MTCPDLERDPGGRGVKSLVMSDAVDETRADSGEGASACASVAASAAAPVESAAAHMARRVPKVRPEQSVGAAIAELSGSNFESVDALYVVDDGGHLVGVVELPTLLAADQGRLVSDLMKAAPACAHPTADQEHVALLAIRHGLTSVPVVDDEGALVGVVPAPALMDILRREHVEDLHRLAGIQREGARARDALEAPPIRRTRDRLPWLLVGLAGSMGAALVTARFERLLETRIAVAFFVPAIVYLADAIGTQTETIVVRGLTVSHAPLGRMLSGELRTGVLLGLLLGALSFPVIAVALGDVRLAAAVAIAILTAGGVATTIGLLLPWLLSRSGRDPALGSGPVATIIQDVLSLIVYFVIVSFFLR